MRERQDLLRELQGKRASPPARYDTAFHAIQILRAAEALHGVSAAEIQARAGVEPGFIDHPLRPLPLAQGSRLIESALALTGDSLLGLRAGLETHLRRALGTAGVFLTHAPNPKVGMENAVRIQNRTSNITASTLDTFDEFASLRVHPRIDRSPYGEQIMDFHVGLAVTSSRRYSNPRSGPVAAEIPADRIERVGREVYEEALGCPILETSGSAGVRYRFEGLLVELDIDVDVYEALSPVVERQMGRLPTIDRFRDVVSAALERGLLLGTPLDLQAVARMLATSPRTLQEHLRREDTSLRRLLDEVRCRLAERWLAEGLTREEVSARLGFSESSAFRRAWRRWHGA